MKIIGLTGGIGSGKSTVLALFQQLNVPVYIADVEAKRLMHTSKEIISGVKEIFGEEAYANNELNRTFIAKIVFNDKEKLMALNAIVHPEVHKDLQRFISTQNAPYMVYESAVLFENNNEHLCDSIILVVAPKDVRIERVLRRDKGTVAEIEARINNQLSDEEKIPKANFVITNLDVSKTEKEVLKIHKTLLEK